MFHPETSVMNASGACHVTSGWTRRRLSDGSEARTEAVTDRVIGTDPVEARLLPAAVVVVLPRVLGDVEEVKKRIFRRSCCNS